MMAKLRELVQIEKEHGKLYDFNDISFKKLKSMYKQRTENA